MNPLIKWRAALIGAVLALISNFAFAGDFNPANGTAWDLYVFGNGEAVAAILSSVGAMVSSSGYKHLLWFIGVMAMFGWGIFIGMSAQNLAKFSPYFVTMIIILYTLVGFPGLGGSSGLRANINIIDRNDLTYTKVVSTSALVGVSSAIISQVGNWLTTAMEQNFSTPGQLKMSGGSSFMMGQRLINDAGQMHIQNTDLRQSIANYTEDCAIPLMASGDIDPGKLILSKNLWADMKSTNLGLMTRVKPMGEPVGVFTNCSDAYNRIGADLTRYVPDLIRANGSAWATTPAFGYTASVMDSAMAYFGGDNSVGAGGAAIKQSAMINTFQRSFGQAAASANNNEMMMAIQTSSAEKSQKAGWIIGASLFNNMMGYVYAILQAFIIGIGPIMAAAILIPGFGFIIVKNYLQILLWTIMWDPLLAVIQFIMAVYGQQDLNALLSVSAGISISNLPALTEKTNNMLIAGGFFATMVPLLAWGLVKGSMAFTEFISHGMGSNLASSAGANAANGNLNMDNISMGNIAMHKQSMDYSASVGMQPTMAHTSGASLITNFNAGGLLTSTAAGAVTMGHSKQAQAAQAKSMDITNSLKTEQSKTKDISDTQAGQFVDAVMSGAGYAKTGGSGSSGGHENSKQSEESRQMAQAFVAEHTAAGVFSASEEQINAFAAKVAASGGIDILGNGLTGNMSWSHSTAAKTDAKLVQTGTNKGSTSETNGGANKKGDADKASTGVKSDLGTNTGSSQQHTQSMSRVLSVGNKLASTQSKSSQLSEKIGRSEGITNTITSTMNQSVTPNQARDLDQAFGNMAKTLGAIEAQGSASMAQLEGAASQLRNDTAAINFNAGETAAARRMERIQGSVTGAGAAVRAQVTSIDQDTAGKLVAAKDATSTPLVTPPSPNPGADTEIRDKVALIRAGARANIINGSTPHGQANKIAGKPPDVLPGNAFMARPTQAQNNAEQQVNSGPEVPRNLRPRP